MGSADLTPLSKERHHKQLERRGSQRAAKLLNRYNTVGLDVASKPAQRQKLVEQVTSQDDSVTHTSIDEGQTGTVFALEAHGEKIAVFKPLSGENFKRKGVTTGQGAVREEAVYLVDRLCGSQAGVPVTSRASIEVDGHEVKGAVQGFVSDSIGFIEDFAMPRDLEKAREFVAQNTVEGLALLDMRVFNMDRHTGNLLLLRREKPHGLGPIDHGCCLPPWWLIGEAIFDAWIEWPQLQARPTEDARTLARKAYQESGHTRKALEDLGLDEPSIITNAVCTLFVWVGVAVLGLPIGKLAVLMVRDVETGFAELSWLEQKVLACAQAAGAQCRKQMSDREEEELVVEGAGLETPAQLTVFMNSLQATFRAELCEAVDMEPDLEEAGRTDKKSTSEGSLASDEGVTGGVSRW